MEFEDLGPVIAENFRHHFTDIEAIAKAYAIAEIGDDVDWRGHISHARQFLQAMFDSQPQSVLMRDR